MELISSANGMSPAWSPDGRRIAFLSNRAEGWDLYVMSSDGGEPIRLTSGATADDPAWHPDGERIAIERGGAIELVRPDGGGREILVERASQPAWSADGRLAFRGNGDLWLRAADGDEARVLVDATEPAWSPDGGRLAVVRHGGISVLDLASDTTHELTRASGDHAPVWRPERRSDQLRPARHDLRDRRRRWRSRARRGSCRRRRAGPPSPRPASCWPSTYTRAATGTSPSQTSRPEQRGC